MKLQTELAKVEDVGLTTIVGAGLDEIRVEPDPEKLSLFGVTLQQLVAKVRDANRSFVAGMCATAADQHRHRRADAAGACRISACCCSPRATAGRSMCATSPA